jgi:hypothetical protein
VVLQTLLLFAVALCGVVAQGAEADALRIDRELVAKHMPFGTVVDPMYASQESEELIGYTRCGDSAIWTGHYLAAQSYRYAVTNSPEALENINRALYGIKMLLDVTGTDLLARCAVPVSSPFAIGITQEEAPNGVYNGILFGEPWYWIGNTSRDQYVGVFFGLTVAHDVVKDPEVRDMVSYLTTRMLDYLRGRVWIVRMPDGSASTTFIGRADQQLSLLKLGRRINPGRFETAYKAMANSVAYSVIPPISLEVLDAHNSYFKFNLDYASFYGLLTSGDNSWVRVNYSKAYDILRKTTDDHGNAHFNMIDRAIRGPNERRDQETRELLEAWLRRTPRDMWVDLRDRYNTCGDADQSCTVITVEERVKTDFLWQRSPFLLFGGGSGRIEGAGIDYLLPYWMGRYYGVITN